MTTDNTEQQSPFTRPSFVAAALIVGLIIVLGIVIAVVNAARNSEVEPTPPGESTPAPTTITGGDSICGLKGEVLSGRLFIGPEADWDYFDTTAYPTSPTFGPGVNENGVRYCYQHSPEGAVFAAANAVVQGADPSTVGAWLDYFVADGPYRDVVVSQESEPGSGGGDARIDVAGFRLLMYEGDTARVDIAIRGTAKGQSVYLSAIFLLVWEAGDWKLSVTDPNDPIPTIVMPAPTGYVLWGA